MATVLQNFGCPPVLINSVADHVHILFELGRTIALSAAVYRAFLQRHDVRFDERYVWD